MKPLARRGSSAGQSASPARGGRSRIPNPEKLEVADEKVAARFGRVSAQILAHPALFAALGSVAAGWKVYRGKRLGPYFRVVFRDRGRQRSIYLGRSEALAEQVRRLLDRLQERHRSRRLFKRLKADARAALRAQKARLRKELAAWGITLKGFEFRGQRAAFKRMLGTAEVIEGLVDAFKGRPCVRTWAGASPRPARVV